MAKKKVIPEYGTTVSRGIEYYRTRVRDADGKQVAVYGKTKEEVYEKARKAQKKIEQIRYSKENPTVEEYFEKWLKMKSATIRRNTLKNYHQLIRTNVVSQIGQMYMREVSPDDLRLLMIPVSKLSSGTYSKVHMLVKAVFESAVDNQLIASNPAANLPAKGGVSEKEKASLTDEQVDMLLGAISQLPVYVFVMLGLYAGLRREEILALQWDCVHLDEKVPYISVQRSWHSEYNRAVITGELKTPASRRNIPIPECLINCLKKEKEKTTSKFVLHNSADAPMTEGQYVSMWRAIRVRTTEERTAYKVVNGQRIPYTIKREIGEHQWNRPDIVCSIDFHVTPHQLRHTYITNLIYAGVDPKTVQYLAGHENSKMTMDVYAKVKYNKPEMLGPVVNKAFGQRL